MSVIAIALLAIAARAVSLARSDWLICVSVTGRAGLRSSRLRRA